MFINHGFDIDAEASKNHELISHPHQTLRRPAMCSSARKNSDHFMSSLRWDKSEPERLILFADSIVCSSTSPVRTFTIPFSHIHFIFHCFW
jgi:hypothetical protein